MELHSFTRLIPLVLTASILSACGGGGGSDGGSNPDPTPTNSSPTANAGQSQSVNEGVVVTLTGSATDSDGSISTYEWTQTSGTSVSIENSTSSSTSFLAPRLSSDEALTFRLTVTDDDGAQGSDTVSITVLDLPESISGVVVVNSLTREAEVSVADEFGSIIQTTRTDANGSYLLELSDSELPQEGVMLLKASLDNGLVVRSVLNVDAVRDNTYEDVPSYLSEYSEAASLLKEVGHLDEQLSDILVVDKELKIVLPALNDSVNKLALTINEFSDDEVLSESDYTDSVLISLLESQWQEAISTNQPFSYSFDLPALIGQQNVSVRSFSGLDNATVASNELTILTGEASIAEVTLDINKNGELAYRTSLNAIVGDQSVAQSTNVGAGVETSITSGNLTLTTTNESFNTNTTISVSQFTTLPTEYDEAFDSVYSIDAGIQPQSSVVLSIPVESDQQGGRIRLAYVNPQDEVIETYKPVRYDSESNTVFFEIDHFSLFGLFESDHNYSLSTEFTIDMIQSDVKGVFDFVKEEVIQPLIKSAEVEELRGCRASILSNTNEAFCESYVVTAASKALSSFIQLQNDSTALVALENLNFRYNTFQLRQSNALEEYTTMMAQLQGLLFAISSSPNLGSDADFFSSGDFSDVFYPSILSGNNIFAGRFHIPGILARQLNLASIEEDTLFQDKKSRIENSDYYLSEKVQLCEATVDFIESYRGKIIAESLKVPSQSPWSDLTQQRESFSRQWELLVKEEFESIVQADTSTDDFVWEIVSYLSAGLRPLTQVLDDLGTVYNITSSVNEAQSLAKEQVGWYVRAAERQSDLNTLNGINCNSSSRCFGATEQGTWPEITYEGARFHVPRETNNKLNTIATWEQEFAACDFAESDYEGPGDTGVDDGDQGSDGGFNQDDPAQPPVQINVIADLQVIGNLELGSTISLDASDSSTSSGNISYQWEVFTPSGSNASPASPQNQITEMTIDSYGAYTVTLTASVENVSASTQYRFSVIEQTNSKIQGGEPRYIFGNAKRGRAGNQGQEWNWEVDVNEDVTELTVWLVSDKSSDDGLGIAVRKDREPTIECRTTVAGTEICNWDRADYEGDRKRNRELIDIENPESGTYYIKAYAFADFNDISIFFEMESDLDKDNDGVPNVSDDFPFDPSEQYDSDGDGIGDNSDAFPNDIAASVDADMDGEPDSWNSGYGEFDSTTGLILDFAVGVSSIRQSAGIVAVDSAIYILPLGRENASYRIIEEPQNGSVQLENDVWLYTPNAGFTGEESFTYEITETDGTIIIVLVSFVVDENSQQPGPDPEPYEGFALTDSTIDFQSDYDMSCQQQYGQDWQQADWEDLKAWYNQGGNLVELVATIGLDTKTAWVNRNGDASFTGTRDYFVAFHNGNKPGSFLDHDNLNNFYVTLGSWTGARAVMCQQVQSDNPGANPFDGQWTITGTADNPSSLCGSQVTAPLVIENGEAFSTFTSGSTTAEINGTVETSGSFSGEFSTNSLGVFGTLEGQFESTTASGTYDWSNPSCTGSWVASKNSNYDRTELNDTGVTICSDSTSRSQSCPLADYPGQDGEHGRDVTALDNVDGIAGFSFTKLDANGDAVNTDVTEWSCVEDKVTGLIWEVKSNDGGLRDSDSTYSWYETNTSINGGHEGSEDGGVCSGSKCDTRDYVSTVNINGLCGASDWRLPTREELRSIVYHGGAGRYVIDKDYFKNTFGVYWTSSTYSKNPERAWTIDFTDDGEDGARWKDHRVYGLTSKILLVRKK